MIQLSNKVQTSVTQEQVLQKSNQVIKKKSEQVRTVEPSPLYLTEPNPDSEQIDKMR